MGEAVTCGQCDSRRFRVFARAFAEPNHRFLVWRLSCDNGHWITPNENDELLVEAVAS